MTLIFVTIPTILIIPIIIMKKLGIDIYYISASENNSKLLEKYGINPVPIEHLEEYNSFSDIYSDPELKIYRHSKDYYTDKIIHELSKEFKNINKSGEKLKLIIYDNIVIKSITTGLLIKPFLQQNKRNFLIDFSISGYYIQKLPKTRIIVIPLRI